ncbi:MAG: hypothetical protein IT319_12135 [Anaerolineae bacterium]|nr:hypothetical protein [Anaerolineae bacterium]
MFRLLVRSALVIAVFAAAALALIRMNGYDDTTVSRFFDSCTPMPCWQGIRPGVTTGEEALVILQNHPWVNAIWGVSGSAYPGGEVSPLLYWRWSENYPFAGDVPFGQQGIIVTSGGVVQQIFLTADIPFGDLWLALGTPASGAVDYIFDTPKNILIENTSLFPEVGAAVTARLKTDCAVRYPDLWRAGVYMWLQDGETLGTENVAYPMYLNVMRTGYHRLWSLIC